MTGLELFQKLRKLPAEDLRKDVVTEGCDCNGDAEDIVVGDTIFITRE